MNASKRLFVCIFSLASCSLWADAQTPHWPGPNNIASQQDKDFAQSLAAMVPEQARTTIAEAAPEKITDGLAAAMFSIAVDDFQKRQLTDALRLFQEGEAIAVRLHAPVVQAAFVVDQGNAERALGKHEDANRDYDRALSLYLEGDAGPQDLAYSYAARALERKDTGDVDGAVEDGLKALDFLQKTPDTVALARALNNLGNAEQMRGEFDQARAHLEWGLRLAQAAKQRQGEAFLLNNISNTYLAQGNPELAEEYCKRAIRIKEELKTPDLPISLVNLARIDDELGRLDEASTLADRAYSLALQSRNPNALISALEEQGEIAKDRGDLNAAQSKTKDALAIARESMLIFHVAGSLLQLSEVEFRQGHNEDAARDAGESIALATEQGMMQILADAYFVKGRAQHQLGQLEEARKTLRLSVNAVESTRDHVAGGDEARSEFFSHYAPVYQELISLCLQMGLREEALEVSEAQKARSMLDVLTRGRTQLTAGLTPQERAEQKQLVTRVTLMEARQAAAQSQPADQASKVLARQMQDARAALSSFRERMYATHPQLARHEGIVPLLHFHDLAPLARPGSAVFEYEVTPSRTFLFVLTSENGHADLHVYTITVDAAQITSMVDRFRSSLARRSPEFAQSSTALYRLLLAPAQKDLTGKRTIIIVPDGALWRLPFQALSPSEGNYLLQRASIAYEPSLAVFHAGLDTGGRRTSAHSLLALGDPAHDLPEADREIESLSTLYGAAQARTFVGEHATIENFRSYAPHYAVIHLATHGVLDDRDPTYSHLLMASTASGQSTTHLNAGEVSGTEIPASLVVLSACETANGKLREGEGLIGLSSSFLMAGVHTVVASQWRVESAGTTKLMLAFHRHLRQGMSKSAALRAAELELASDPAYRHPFYWAGFVLMGQA